MSRTPRREPRREHVKPPAIGHPAREGKAIVLDYMPRGYYDDPHREHREAPVAQALGVRTLLLLDGTPLEPVEPLEYVALAREIQRSIPAAELNRRPPMVRVSLACIPGRDRNVYCYPYNVREPSIIRAVVETVEAEDPRVVVLTDIRGLKSVAKEKGLPEKILVVPRTPITYKDLSDFARRGLEDAVRAIIRDHEEVFVEFFNIAEPINIRLHSLSLLKGIGKRTLVALLRARDRKRFQSLEEIKRIIKADPVDSLVDKILEEIRGEAKYYLFVPPPRPDVPYLRYLELARKSLRQRQHASGSQAKQEG